MGPAHHNVVPPRGHPRGPDPDGPPAERAPAADAAAADANGDAADADADADADRQFCTAHLSDDLRGRSVRGGAVTVGSQLCRMALTTGATMALARLLTPGDFGLLAMVFVVHGFVEVFRDLGLSTATVQRDKITHEQVSTLFWLNAAVGLAIMLLVTAAAPALAAFYGDPRVTGVARLLAAGFLLSGLNVQHRALLNRQMRFGPAAAVDVLAVAFGAATSITCAYFRQGYWSLVYGQLAQGLFMTAGTWMLSGWRPGLPSRAADVGSMLRFGANLTGFTGVNYLARNLDNLLIGKILGATTLGLYAKAYQLLLLPVQQINMPLTRVAVPALSRLQNDPQRYREFYTKAILMVSAFGMPLVAFLFVTAHKAIPMLLGPQWGEAVVIFRILAPAAFFGTFNVATGWVYMSLGRTDRMFRWGIFTSAVTVAGFFVGVNWGAEGVAAAFSLVFCGLTMGPPSVAYAFRGSPLKPVDLLSALWRPAAAAVGAGLLLYGADSLLLGLGHAGPVALWQSVLLDAALYALLYLAAWLVLPGGRQFLGDVLRLVSDLRSGSPRRGFEVVIAPKPAPPQ